ncbi:MAG: DUF2306 domain-containing protein [Saprospiraceae bacterium]
MMLTANKNLNRSIRSLLYIAFVGQLAFCSYILLHFGGTAFQGDWNTWTESMIHGIIEGDPVGNAAVIFHIMLAFIITFSGPLQFFEWFRTNARSFHKYNGRIYILTALLITVGALFMVWNRPATIGGQLGRVSLTINAGLIIWFAIMAWRTGVQRKFVEHRRWAIRTFVVVSGVWFFRIGFGTWILVTGFTAPGVKEDLTGWFDRMLYFTSYLGPLLVTEIYLRVKASDSLVAKKRLTIFLFALCPLLIAGTCVTAMVFWLS